jgi:23S rRNA pseudouridine1911/1915/1917 synthase
MSADIRIIYEDADLLVCHKRAGTATEGAAAGRMDLISAARNYLARKNRTNTTGRQRNLPPYVATVNRLDQPVEGVVVLAKTKKAASDLARQIKEKKADKYYYALCYGEVPERKEPLSDFIIRREDNRLAQILTAEEKETVKDNTVTLRSGEKVRLMGGDIKSASLEYEVIARSENATLLRVHLLTGRFHQIRAQLSNLGHPILGDERYFTEESRLCSEGRGIREVCLAAYSYSFDHPATGRRVSFEITPDNPAIRSLIEADGR